MSSASGSAHLRLAVALSTVVLGCLTWAEGAHAALNLTLAGCPNATAGTTDFGTVYRGQPRVTTNDCTVVFGDDGATSMLKVYQVDGAGEAMGGGIAANTLAYWPLDGSGADLSGNGNTVLLGAGATAPTWGPGRTGQGLVFDGIDDLARAPWAPSLQLAGAMTMSAWIRKVDLASGVPIVEYNNGAGFGVHLWNWDAGDKLFTNAVDTGGGSHTVMSGAGVVGAGAWHHVATTYDGATATLYYDGAQVASTIVGAFTLRATAGYDVYLGHRPTGGQTFKGTIDDVRVVARALSAAEVAAEASIGASSLADYAGGASDWDQGASTFGGCLRSVSGAGVIGTWTVDGDGACTANDADPWYPFARTIADASAKVAASTTAGTTNATVALRFGARPSSTQPLGAYQAPLVVEVLTPDV